MNDSILSSSNGLFTDHTIYAMTIIVLLISISLGIALIFLGVFLWSMKSGQYDDTYTPSVRMLFDEKRDRGAGEKTKSGNGKVRPQDKNQHD